jgi:peptidoglycan/xylan/chitin deacetylase (PgdA/CDA1 family)
MWQDLSIASSRVGPGANLEAVLDNAFHEGNYTAGRGYVIYYRMDYYKDPNVIPDAMLKIAENRIDTIAYEDGIEDNGSAYTIKPIGEILKGDKVYNYPLNDQDILALVKDRIYPGHLEDYTHLGKFDYIKSRYIGNPDVSAINTLPGFTEEEVTEIDKTGRFTDDPVLFLTFDDWATDKAINQLLYVLDKHGVKASFFVRTNYIHNNPNILRAIAEAGHDVASHSDQHLPFAIRGEDIEEDGYTKPMYHSLNDEEIAERRQDLLSSYNKLQYTIGDVSVNGRPALTTLFRPPTLAMSREGMEAIFDMGFSHIVSGDVSMQDYDETDPEVLADRLINGTITEGGREVKVQNGSILILHMSDFKQNPISDPNVTAKALDIAIPVWKSKGYGFARLSDYLR